MLHNSLDEMMQEYAERATELGRDFDITLDYSEESLQGLERILAQLSDEHRAFVQKPTLANSGLGWGTQKQRGAQPEVEEQMVMMCKLWGGYLGEVVRRRWGGEWAMDTYPGAEFATLTLNVRGAKLFPSMKVYRRLTEGAGDDVWAFYRKIREKLGAAPRPL
jgi:hypothetical protein